MTGLNRARRAAASASIALRMACPSRSARYGSSAASEMTAMKSVLSASSSARVFTAAKFVDLDRSTHVDADG